MTISGITLTIFLLVLIFVCVFLFNMALHEEKSSNRRKILLDKLEDSYKELYSRKGELQAENNKLKEELKQLQNSCNSLIKNVIKYSDTIKQIRQLTHMDSEDYEKPNSP